MGLCPGGVEESLDGIHDGTHAGRACWVIAGILYKGEFQGTFAHKFKNCEVCDFYQAVKTDEFPNFLLSAVILNRLNGR